MFKILVWAQKKEGMADDAFRRYWLEQHAPLARRAYPRLMQYSINLVTRVPREGSPFHGVAELVWTSKDDFDADVRSPEARPVVEDLKNFSQTSGTLFVEEHEIRGA
jgi:uncharacterized protein (TIGR02118 family)